jgi:hypothetical protein
MFGKIQRDKEYGDYEQISERAKKREFCVFAYESALYEKEHDANDKQSGNHRDGKPSCDRLERVDGVRSHKGIKIHKTLLLCRLRAFPKEKPTKIIRGKNVLSVFRTVKNGYGKKNGCSLSLKYYLADSNGVISAFLRAPTTE